MQKRCVKGSLWKTVVSEMDRMGHRAISLGIKNYIPPLSGREQPQEKMSEIFTRGIRKKKPPRKMTTITEPPIPSSILIVGAGVFGLSTALALAQRPAFHNTTLTLLERQPFPAADGASTDTSRIIRADYADDAYALLAHEAAQAWRGPLGADGRFMPSGLCLVTNDASPAGARYLSRSLANVRARLRLPEGPRARGGVTVLRDAAAVRDVMGAMGGDAGQAGYVNWTSGWAHAADAMRYVRAQVEATGRVRFRQAEVRRLVGGDGGAVVGVETTAGETLTAELTVLATGAWTPRLVDLRGVASATGHPMAYVRVTAEEQARWGALPVLLNESNGMFIIPPRDGELKVARHGFGYANPRTIAQPEAEAADAADALRPTMTVSVPHTTADDPSGALPAEAQRACREYLARCMPELARREFVRTRLCWYTDTATGDWVVGRHPRRAGLFVATGGSGHAFKFLPVVGERVVDVMVGRDRDALGARLRRRWAWHEGRRGTEEHVWTGDWRGGRQGMVLAEEAKL